MQGKPRPHETIPNAYGDFTRGHRPPGYREDDVSFDEPQAAGFYGGTRAEPKPWTSPGRLGRLGSFLAARAPKAPAEVSGQSFEMGPAQVASAPAGSKFLVLRDPSGAIVATWDEGRWWTPEESDALTAALISEVDDADA
jgi:hypothetical protein